MPDASPKAGHTNKHGRKFGRGSRPWLLMPKVLSVCALLGGLAGVLLVGPTRPEAAKPLIHWLVIPGAVGVLVFGAALLAIQPIGVMLRQRWLVVKLALAAPTLIAMHIVGRYAMERYEGSGDIAHLAPLWWVCGAGLVVLIGLTVLGRVKPRLGKPFGPPRKK